MDDDNVGVCVGTSSSSTPVTSSPHAFFIPTSGQTKDEYRHTIRKELGFEAFASNQSTTNSIPANNNDDLSLKSSKSLTVYQSMKHKRQKYRSKTFSPKNLSNKIKRAMSPSRKSVQSQSSGWHQRSSNKDRTRLYHSLEDKDDETPLLPHELDDRSCALSLPSRLVTSMSRKKKSPSTTSLTSKRMWNKLILMDSLSTFKTTPETSTRITNTAVAKATRSMAAMELGSSSSTESSCTSSLGGRKTLDPETKGSQLQSWPKQGFLLYSARVDEEEDESSDSDSEGDNHPQAGSFAYAIRRRDSSDERGSFGTK